MNYKIRNISLLCVLLSLSAGSAVAEPGPILSPDGTAFQLNFPQVIVDELNKFVGGVEGHERYGAFFYQVEPSDNGPLCQEVGICAPFRAIAEAMMPYFNISQEERQRRMSCESLVRTAKTLLELDEKEIILPSASTAYIKTALNYFLNILDHDVTYPANCVSTACWRKLVALAKGIALNPAVKTIDEYKEALDKIAAIALYQRFGKK
jgi:hypothetical protein